jgi:hypothetical protein
LELERKKQRSERSEVEVEMDVVVRRSYGRVNRVYGCQTVARRA